MGKRKASLFDAKVRFMPLLSAAEVLQKQGIAKPLGASPPRVIPRTDGYLGPFSRR